MSTFQLMPEIPEHPDPKKPSDYIGHMISFCNDFMADIENTKELDLGKKVLFMAGLKQFRMQLKQIYQELKETDKDIHELAHDNILHFYASNSSYISQITKEEKEIREPIGKDFFHPELWTASNWLWYSTNGKS